MGGNLLVVRITIVVQIQPSNSLYSGFALLQFYDFLQTRDPVCFLLVFVFVHSLSCLVLLLGIRGQLSMIVALPGIFTDYFLSDKHWYDNPHLVVSVINTMYCFKEQNISKCMRICY